MPDAVLAGGSSQVLRQKATHGIARAAQFFPFAPASAPRAKSIAVCSALAIAAENPRRALMVAAFALNASPVGRLVCEPLVVPCSSSIQRSATSLMMSCEGSMARSAGRLAAFELKRSGLKP
jgi:hypothetical protein